MYRLHTRLNMDILLHKKQRNVTCSFDTFTNLLYICKEMWLGYDDRVFNFKGRMVARKVTNNPQLSETLAILYITTTISMKYRKIHATYKQRGLLSRKLSCYTIESFLTSKFKHLPQLLI